MTPRLTFAWLLATLLATASALAQTAAPASPDTRIPALLDTLARTRAPITAAISPDGAFVAWTVSGTAGDELHLTGISPTGPQDAAWDRILSPDSIGDVTNLRPGACPASHPAWSPDGRTLAFLSACTLTDTAFTKDAQQNIFLYTLATNTMRQLTHLHGNLGSPQWSPNGKTIGFLFVENATRRAGALDAMKPWSGVIGEDGVEVQRIYCIPNTGGIGNWLTPPDLHVYEFSWAPLFSSEITFTAAPTPGENNWWIAKLYSRHLGPLTACFGESTCNYDGPGIEPLQVIADPEQPGPLHLLQIAVPRYSPDGSGVAFIAGLMSDQGSTGGDVYLVPSHQGAAIVPPRDLTPNRHASPAFIDWQDDHTLGISEHVGGDSRITLLDLNTGKDVPGLAVTLPETIIAGVDVMSVSVARHSNNIALIRQSYDHAPEVWAGPSDNLKQLTHLNDDLKPAWGKSESITYTSAGQQIQGWLLYPAGWTPNSGDPTKKYPLIVSVHGGPSSAVTPRWPTAAYGPIPFSALGYFVFMPNPRGSFGQGEKFTAANYRDFGYGDLADINAGVDLLEKRFPIDRDREGITGWSYGGFMTMFAVTQTTRFHAAVAGAGIANWQSYYGENSIDQWMVPFFGKTVYDDPAIYARSSPIAFIQRVETPTLVVVGDRDGECPAPQSFEFWHALRAQGVKTQLVIYPNEGHHFTNSAHQRDVLQRALDWFNQQMPAN